MGIQLSRPRDRLLPQVDSREPCRIGAPLRKLQQQLTGTIAYVEDSQLAQGVCEAELLEQLRVRRCRSWMRIRCPKRW
jgi:hypothetical protein